MTLQAPWIVSTAASAKKDELKEFLHEVVVKHLQKMGLEQRVLETEASTTAKPSDFAVQHNGCEDDAYMLLIGSMRIGCKSFEGQKFIALTAPGESWKHVLPDINHRGNHTQLFTWENRSGAPQMIEKWVVENSSPKLRPTLQAAIQRDAALVRAPA